MEYVVTVDCVNMASNKTELDVNQLMDSEKFKTFMLAITKDLKNSMEDIIKPLRTKIMEQDSEIQNLKDQLDKKDSEILDLQEANDSLQETQVSLQQQLNNHQEYIEMAQMAIEEMQLYSRRNCVVISGIPESKGEDTDEIVTKLANEKMNVPLTKEDLDRSHRLGKPTTDKPRPIIAKFVRYNTRTKFLLARKNLKGTKTGVQEMVTKHVGNLLQRAEQLKKNAPWVKNVWIWNGNVHVYVKPDNQDTGYKRIIRSQKCCDQIWHDHKRFYKHAQVSDRPPAWEKKSGQ